MYMSDLSTICLCTICMPGSPEEGIGSPWNWSYRWLQATIWVLEINLDPLEEQPRALKYQEISPHLDESS